MATRVSRPRLTWESAGVTAILAVAAWLRLRHLGIAMFYNDQAIALRIAHDILDGHMRTVGLASSAGASNPPLYVYIVAVIVAIHDGALFATASVAVLSVAAIAVAYLVIRPRFGGAAALVTAALFATAPWAVFYGRLLFQQDFLPLVTVSLLWSVFVVLERNRARVAMLVPLLFVIAFSLNLSAVALILPIGALIAYRARNIDWRAIIAGAVVGVVVLLGPWLAHNAKHGFRDFSLIASNGRGHGGTAGTGTIDAIRETINLASAEGWSFVTGAHHQNGAAWTLGRVAGIVVLALLAVGIVTSIARTVRDGRHPQIDTARRALLLIWLIVPCLAYITSGRHAVAPHYLLVSYPVSFLLAALGLQDLASLVRRRRSVVSLTAAGAIAAGFVAFTLSFQAFVRQHDGTTGAYGVIYDETSALAKAVHERNLHTAFSPSEYLAWGHLNPPPGTTGIVTDRVRLRDHSPLPCSGQVRSFGPIEACFPR
jgi:4-amino-4-deoxy-L-arabinose transferase-like glycosyltransferase